MKKGPFFQNGTTFAPGGTPKFLYHMWIICIVFEKKFHTFDLWNIWLKISEILIEKMHSFGLILTKHSVAIYNMIMSTFAGRKQSLFQNQKKNPPFTFRMVFCTWPVSNRFLSLFEACGQRPLIMSSYRKCFIMSVYQSAFLLLEVIWE